MNERELIARLQKRDETAFEELLRQYEKKVYTLCFRMCGNSEDAAEAAQEAFLAAWQGLRFFRGDSSFSTWLYRLTSNACVDLLRREGRHRAAAGPSLDDDQDLNRDVQDVTALSPQEEAERREYERMSYMTMLRSEAFRDMPAAGWRFESAAVTTPQLAKARGYAQNWDEFKKAGIGLLLFGNVGTGKSYAAGCVANALIDRLESVLFVGMSDVVNRMQGNFGSDRDNYMKSLMRPDLLILDDLGAERNTSFGKERVFDVVDKRLLTGKPMIVTTNIPLSVMKQAVDLDDRRIYDRILEVCVPIMFDGDSFRKSTAADNLKTAARLLG